jgi:hypothetical protein
VLSPAIAPGSYPDVYRQAEIVRLPPTRSKLDFIPNS